MGRNAKNSITDVPMTDMRSIPSLSHPDFISTIHLAYGPTSYRHVAVTAHLAHEHAFSVLPAPGRGSAARVVRGWLSLPTPSHGRATWARPQQPLTTTKKTFMQVS